MFAARWPQHLRIDVRVDEDGRHARTVLRVRKVFHFRRIAERRHRLRRRDVIEQPAVFVVGNDQQCLFE